MVSLSFFSFYAYFPAICRDTLAVRIGMPVTNYFSGHIIHFYTFELRKNVSRAYIKDIPWLMRNVPVTVINISNLHSLHKFESLINAVSAYLTNLILDSEL